MTQSHVVVEFDVTIDELEKYDVVLEIFQKDTRENMSSLTWFRELQDGVFKEAKFDLLIESLAIPSEPVAHIDRPSLASLSTVGPSLTEDTNLMSARFSLINALHLSPGGYRVRCTNQYPLRSLEGRLVKVNIEKIRHPK